MSAATGTNVVALFEKAMDLGLKFRDAPPPPEDLIAWASSIL